MDATFGNPQRVDRARAHGTRTRLLRKPECIELERYGHIHALAAVGKKAGRSLLETIQGHQQPPIFHVLPVRQREARMDQRRT